MKKKIPFWKKLNAQLHLWLGLASGLIVLIVSITGCIFAFQTEITEWLHRDLLFVQPQSTPLPLSVLQAKAQAAMPGKPISYITTYTRPDRAWDFMTYKAGDEKTAVTIFDEIADYQSVFINPYTGAVTGIYDYKHDFFLIIKYLHWSLLLSTRIGQPIVGVGVLLFVVLLITGLVLWWPKKWNKHTREQSFKIKWKARYKRINYDLHNVLGFYSLLIALILALTGLVYAFKWFETAVYVTAARTIKPPQHKTVSSDTLRNGNGLDIAYLNAVNAFPVARRFGVSPVGPDKTATIRISAYWDKETFYNRDDLQFDKSTGQLLLRETDKDRNAGEKLLGMNYDIHVGAIAGLPGKIIAFLISLICASLPVTGLLVWLYKGKKKSLR